MEYWKKRISSELVWNSDMYSLQGKIFILLISLAILYPQDGCTDIDACNYDVGANEDDGSCYYPTGCDNECDSTLENDECGVCGGLGITTLTCYLDADGDGFHEGIILSNAREVYTACNASCSALGDGWSDDMGNGLHTARPPILPEIQAVSDNEKITLLWNNASESSTDSLTGYSDFEGYRIYRSTDGGNTWGDEWDKIYNFAGNHVGWKPYAQFDLIQELDSLHCAYSNGYLGENNELCYSIGYAYDTVSPEELNDDDVIIDEDSLVYLPKYIRGEDISGFDPMASWINLGDSDSLKRSFIDTDVLDGVEYTYAVTAYDMGMTSFDIDFINADEDADSDDDYCGGDDSYCDDSDFYCNGNDSSCLPNDVTCGSLDQSDCGNMADFGLCDGWNVIEYTDDISCADAGYEWTEIIISDLETCEAADYEWIIQEYFDADSCEAANYEWNIIYFQADTIWVAANPGHFLGVDYSSIYNELWGYPSFESPKLYESFTDYNINGICDNEPYVDKDGSDANNNGICDETGDWSSRCEENTDDCINVAVVQPGYKASNITFPADDPEVEFIIPDPTNVGNGESIYNIVNEYELTDAVLRFEINAGLAPNSFGDASGSFATLNPGLYCYEAISLDNFAPISTWDEYVTNLSQDSLDYYLDLPGVEYNSSDSNKISIPEYKIENFPLTGVDNPQYSTNYTDWFDGIQFRFDNGPNGFTNSFQLVELKELTYVDPLLEDYANIKMRYKSETHLQNRLMYRYKIEFSTSFVDTAVLVAPLSACDHLPGFKTQIPFKIKNLVTGKYVKLEHSDKGIYGSLKDYGEATQGNCSPNCNPITEDCIESQCITKVGYNDCTWEYNEPITLIDTVYSTYGEDGVSSTADDGLGWDEKVFALKIGFDFIEYALLHIDNFFQRFFNDDLDWEMGATYGTNDVIFYEGMLYRSTQALADSIPPNQWFDNNGDNVNDNAWKMLYPWEDGESVEIEPYGWYQDGDAWVADLSDIGTLDENSNDDLDNISVVPNPYIVNSNYFNESPGNHLMRFTRLPDKCDISIYTVSGEFVTSISHDDPFGGNEWWNLKNGNNQEIAPGLYIYVVETPSGNKKINKFAVVR